MTGTWPTSALIVLTPLREGVTTALGEDLEALSAEPSPFARLASTHFVRWVVVDGGRGRAGAEREARWARPPGYLLFSALTNSPEAELVAELRSAVGPDVDRAWGHCVGYPGHHRAAAFDHYLRRHRLRPSQVFTAYDATVPEIHRAVGLRRRHTDLALRCQALDDGELRRAFLDEFGSGR
ncbi:MAG: hypothetical protein WB441_10520 [Nocardioidaceae bacterium]